MKQSQDFFKLRYELCFEHWTVKKKLAVVVLSVTYFKCTKTQYDIETSFLENNKVHKLLKYFSKRICIYTYNVRLKRNNWKLHQPRSEISKTMKQCLLLSHLVLFKCQYVTHFGRELSSVLWASGDLGLCPS